MVIQSNFGFLNTKVLNTIDVSKWVWNESVIKFISITEIFSFLIFPLPSMCSFEIARSDCRVFQIVKKWSHCNSSCHWAATCLFCFWLEGFWCIFKLFAMFQFWIFINCFTGSTNIFKILQSFQINWTWCVSHAFKSIFSILPQCRLSGLFCYWLEVNRCLCKP